MKNEPDLRQLVEKAKQYDPDALSEIYEQLSGCIYRYVLARVRNREVAEDITGQTFLKMLEEIDGYEWKGGGLKPWLFRISHNLTMDWFRGEQVMLCDQAFPGTVVSAEHTALINDSVNEALAAVETLGESQRQVVLLRLVGGLSCRETAYTLAMSEGNVRVLQHRALDAIRKCLRVRVNA